MMTFGGAASSYSAGSNGILNAEVLLCELNEVHDFSAWNAWCVPVSPHMKMLLIKGSRKN